jgi:hypothetical protein
MTNHAEWSQADRASSVFWATMFGLPKTVLEPVWNRSLAGEGGMGAITKFDASHLTSCIAGEVRDFDPEDFMEQRAARRMASFSQYAVVCAACSAGTNASGDAGELMAVGALGYPATCASGPKRLPPGALVRYLD